MVHVLVVGLGGFIGAIARYGLSSLAHRVAGLSFPVGTLLVNVLGCFALGGPIGLALEVFDASGVYRTTENGATIDTSGQWAGQDYADVRELAALLKDDPTLTSCLVQRAYNYGTAREPTRAELQWLNTTHAQLRSEGVHWRELMLRIAGNPDFYTVPDSLVVESQ